MKAENNFRTIFLKNAFPALIIMLALIFASCAHSPNPNRTKVKIAMVVPYKSCPWFQRTADWCLYSLERSVPDELSFSFEPEWYDEDEINIAQTARTLASRSDLLAIIGPMKNTNAETFAQECFYTKKPLFAPVAASESIQRAYSLNAARIIKDPFLWCLSESDVSQSEALLSKAYSQGGRSISLLSSADTYGKTFFEWIPFLSHEFKLELKQNIRYASENTGADYETGTPATELSLATDTVLASGADYVICAVASYKDVATILEKHAEIGDTAPKLLFTNTAFDKRILENAHSEGIEGTAAYANPETGFSIAYRTKFGEAPTLGEAQFYDALMLCCFAVAKNIIIGNFDPSSIQNRKTNEIIRELTKDNGEVSEQGWSDAGMALMFGCMQENVEMTMSGASGILTFDEETLTTITSSTYAHWSVTNGKFILVDFTSSHGTAHTAKNKASWEWSVMFDGEYQAELDASTSANVHYEELESQWAVIIAASKGWINYRHQADALHIYKILKSNGFPDNRIILIMEDDIANNSQNKKPGKVFTRINGDNLYSDVHIDYKLSDITVSDLKSILLGNHLASFPDSDVLSSDSQANILWFWTGHGKNRDGNPKKGQFEWSGKASGAGFTTEIMAETLNEMKTHNRFRKLLVLTEACYSASVMNVAEGIDGVLAITASNGSESSLSDEYSTELQSWLSNRFTYNLTESIVNAGDSSLHFSDLYKYLVLHTIGSHVCVFNSARFENLNIGTVAEFFSY